ncbi:MAG: hypothetical protein GEU26_16930 [Nitrososphaeraceae archaeon]|nr:hypothetical protein [Nitrososphaeraceae archaeon]
MNLRISLKVSGLLIVHLVGTILLTTFAVNNVTGTNISSSDTSNTSSKSSSTELRTDGVGSGNASTQRTHSDLIRSCVTFREILSTDMAYSCDYSMLYYKGQCEQNSTLLRQNETEAQWEAKNDLSFCSDPRVDRYIQKNGLTDAPRSPTLMPGYESPIA